MGRPRKTDAERIIHASLPAPRDLTSVQRAVWTRDIATMPPGFFAPCDTAVLRIYCDVANEYEHIHRTLLHAQGVDRQKLAREFRAISLLRLSCMRALRMLPHSRLHKSHAANLANELTLPQGADDLPANEQWRLLFPPKDRSN